MPGLLGFFVLFLLSTFFAHLIAPAVDAVRRRARRGPRQRPLPRAAAILSIYAACAGIVGPLSLVAGPRIGRAIDAATTGAERRLVAVRTDLARLAPVQPGARLAGRSAMVLFDSFARDMRRSLDDVAAARRQAVWLLLVPACAFVLLNHTPAFRRSALRRLPHGHLQWRLDEYLTDVNSAIAGYMRAQVAAGALVGVTCAIGFTLLRLPSPLALSATAGVLEFVPVIGPAMVVILATAPGGGAAIAALAFLFALRIVQDYAVYPRLVRRGMHLPSAAVVVAVWIGAAISGAAGVVVAIPAAGFASVSYRHWREYREIEQLVARTARERGARTINAETAEHS